MERVWAVSMAFAACSANTAPTASEPQVPPGFVRVPTGHFTRGDAPMYDEEGPPTTVVVSGFLLKAHEVTNAEFLVFVESTGYVTEAERRGGSGLFVDAAASEETKDWWRLSPGATWRSPAGAGSDLRDRARHPVVHVTLEDARRYAAWAGARLPQEVEWEYAAALGLPDRSRSESGAFAADGSPLANVWTGPFPTVDTAADGYAGTAPVGSFPADRLGAHDLIGNVWEWTDTPFARDGSRWTIKGGSHLCAATHCRRFRPSARQAMEPDFSTSHLGFRVVKPLPDDVASGR